VFLEFFNKEEYMWKKETEILESKEETIDSIWKKVVKVMTCYEEHDEKRQEPLVSLNWE
jgi:hypothetical protein